MLLVDGEPLLGDDDEAPKTASVLWQEKEPDWYEWEQDLYLLAESHIEAIEIQGGVNRCASKLLSMDVERAMEVFYYNSDNAFGDGLCAVKAFIAAGIDKEDLGKALIIASGGRFVKRRPGEDASGNDRRDIANALLSANADVNYSDALERGATALHKCCSAGYIDVAKGLIAAHADVNAKSRNNQTP